MSAARTGRPATCGAKRLIATPDTAAVRWAVIGPPSRIAIGRPVAASLSTTTALIAGRPSALFVPNPATHFIPTRSSLPSVGRAPKVGRHRVHERPIGPRVHRDLRRQLRIVDERRERALGQLQPLGERRHRGRDVGRGEVADRAPGHPRECTRHLG